jgi:hypothetical protein
LQNGNNNGFIGTQGGASRGYGRHCDAAEIPITRFISGAPMDAPTAGAPAMHVKSSRIKASNIVPAIGASADGSDAKISLSHTSGRDRSLTYINSPALN